MTTLRDAANKYAELGVEIFPLIPGSKTPTGGKGVYDAAVDASPWNRDPNYNIGMSCGANNIVVIDFDLYKGAPPVDSLFDDDDLQDVIIVDTARGGVHLWFKQPETRISCPKSTIKDIDIKGDGGYVVAAPSTFDGGRYKFRSGHSPVEIPLSNLAVLPQHIIDLLIPAKQEWARTDSAPIPVEAEEIRARLACIPPLGTYDDWLEILMAVHSAYPDEVGVALCEEWSPGKPGEIAKKFASFKKGGRGIGTLIYLSNQHGYQARVNQEIRAQIAQVKAWVGTEASVLWARSMMRQSSAPFITTLRTLLDICVERGSWKIKVSCRDLATMLATSPMSASRRINKMAELGIVNKEDTEKGQTLDLSPLSSVKFVTEYIESGDTVTNLTTPFAARHTGDDAFAVYPYAYAVKRRGGVSPLMTSLGATGLELWGHLADGGTIKEIAAASGYSIGSVRNAVKKFMACGLLDYDEEDSTYVLKENAEEILDEVRPHMATYHVGQMRIARAASATANYAMLRLRRRKAMEPREVMWWENLRADKDKVAMLIFEQLEEQGFDGRMKVGKEKAVRRRTRIDWGEEWRTWGRNLFDAYNILADKHDIHTKIRLLTTAEVGPDASPETFKEGMRVMRERVEMMLVMSHKRVAYERTAVEPQEELPHTEPQHKLQLEMELG